MNIEIIGAKEHNLRDITVSIPRNKFVVITGVSGSGKSTLAYDTIFAEAQREYLESLSSYARIGLPKIAPSHVDIIKGLSPSILINQQLLARNPRSTVGTVTEVYAFLRLLFSRAGHPSTLSAGDFSFNIPAGACPTCKGLGVELRPDIDRLIDWDKSLAEGAILHRRWIIGSRYLNIINAVGFFDMNKPLKNFDQKELDTLLYSEPVYRQNDEPGYVQSFSFEGVLSRLIKRLGDSRGQAGNAYDQEFFSLDTCSECRGARINSRARSVMVNGKSIVDLVTMEIKELLPYMDSLSGSVAASIAPYIKKMLGHLIDIGVGYLTLSRSVSTLSNGESQRVKLARQLGSSLTELIYVLDEPTAGLHARDIDHLSSILKQLVVKPNTVIVVEHDKSIMLKADYIVDMGPGAGIYGGLVVAQGTPQEIMNSGSSTGKFLSGEAHIPLRQTGRQPRGYLEIRHAKLHNLKDVNVQIPTNMFTCITGVSGSGKSSLIEVLLKRYPQITVVDQSPPGTIVTSIPATYVKAFDEIRKEFAQATGQNVSLFTFNGKGACEECGGLGYQVTDMHFLGSVSQVCEGCNGKRYNPEALRHKYCNKTIADVLDMTIVEAHTFFNKALIRNKLGMLIDVGLGYLRLGQSLDTLSGGEAQRIKLVSRLSRQGDTYVLDEPTRGLHFADIERLLAVLNKLVTNGNTVVVVEHNLDVIKNADWVIDLGPEGGENGGLIVAEGPPELIAQSPRSYTGMYLKEILGEVTYTR